MANFDEAFSRFKGIEFLNSEDVLHKNSGELGLTYFGIYESANPNWSGWASIRASLLITGQDIKKASRISYADRELEQKVRDFYYVRYWTRIRLDEIHSQKIAEEMFFFYVHIGNSRRVVRFAQSIVGAVVDGVIGRDTITALNYFDEDVFDKEYDRKESSHYKRLVKRYPLRFSRFLKGWLNRARKI